jgi:2-polyprenyl-3-methyl-5-hydroxy-6-metoxy-1,4-benzoquinol methylase
MSLDGPYSLDASGIMVPSPAIAHRDDEFNEAQLDVYAKIEPRHFWFAGRRRFLTHAVHRAVRRFFPSETGLRAVDLGAGTGAWAAHLVRAMPGLFAEIAVADSSRRALDLAARVAGPPVARYQVDLRQLGWHQRWDVAFLLDVLEHIADDRHVLSEIAGSLRPGGLLFVTTPALDSLRTYNDDLEHHARRYSRRDFQRLAEASALELIDARYFMFLLSPLLVASRWFGPKIERLTNEERVACYRHTHRVPWPPLNAALRLIFSFETPLGHWVHFPWGTSLLGIFRRPATSSR